MNAVAYTERKANVCANQRQKVTQVARAANKPLRFIGTYPQLTTLKTDDVNPVVFTNPVRVFLTIPTG